MMNHGGAFDSMMRQYDPPPLLVLVEAKVYWELGETDMHHAYRR